MNEPHAEQWHIALNSERSIRSDLDQAHGDFSSFGGDQSANSTDLKRAIQRRRLRVRVPGVPVLDVLVDLEDSLRRRGNLDLRFNFHGQRIADSTVSGSSVLPNQS
jgi:hypothetical protein